MYLNFVQYPVIGHTDGVLLVFFSLFIVTLLFYFACFYFFFSFGFSLNSYGTAENNHSKVPQFRDGVVVDLKKAASAQVRHDSRTSTGCDLRALGGYTERRPLRD